MITILFLWTTVAKAPYFSDKDWRALSEFNSPAACQAAAQHLGLEKDRFRCIPKG